MNVDLQGVTLADYGLVCDEICTLPHPCSDLNDLDTDIMGIELSFDGRYSYTIPFKSVETDILWGTENPDACVLEFFNTGVDGIFQIGDPFF